MKTSAPAISRQLRANGFGVIASRSKYGLLVTRSFRSVSVTAQFPTDKESEKRATEVAEFLKSKGHKVHRNESLVWVTEENHGKTSAQN